MKTEYDFSKAKRAKDVPHLAKLQAQDRSQKKRISIMLDEDVIESFRQRAAKSGTAYQSEINRALRAFLSDGEPLTIGAMRAELRAQSKQLRKSIEDRVLEKTKDLIEHMQQK